jgi:general secretion pathway protein I
MVALAIVAIAFLSFYRLFSQAIGADSAARFYTIAPLLAQQKITEINNGIISVNYDATGTFADYPGYTWQARMLDVSSETLKKAVSDMKQVDITISGGNDNRRFTLRSYVFLRD